MTDWFPRIFGIGADVPFQWVLALAIGIGLGAVVGAIQGFIIAYIGVPSFIVTLGGLLSIRGLVWYQSKGAAVIGPRPDLPAHRRRRPRLGRRAHHLDPRRRRLRRRSSACSSTAGASDAATASRCDRCGPRSSLGVVGCGVVLGAGLVRQQRLLAEGPRRPVRHRARHHRSRPAACRSRSGSRSRSSLLIGVTLVMTLRRHPTTVRPVRVRLRRQPRRRRAGRHQHAARRSSRPTC